jgi:hypothetical protein
MYLHKKHVCDFLKFLLFFFFSDGSIPYIPKMIIGIIINSWNMKNDWEKKEKACSAYLSSKIFATFECITLPWVRCSFFKLKKKQHFVAYLPITQCLIFILWRSGFINDNNFGYEKITILVEPGCCNMDVKIYVCVPCKYGRFMLLIDNNLLLPGARLHILNNIYQKWS